jgi:hypothetical protein
MKHERLKFEVDNLHVWIFEFLCIISLIFLFLDCRASLAMTEEKLPHCFIEYILHRKHFALQKTFASFQQLAMTERKFFGLFIITTGFWLAITICASLQPQK